MNLSVTLLFLSLFRWPVTDKDEKVIHLKFYKRISMKRLHPFGSDHEKRKKLNIRVTIRSAFFVKKIDLYNKCTTLWMQWLEEKRINSFEELQLESAPFLERHIHKKIPLYIYIYAREKW